MAVSGPAGTVLRYLRGCGDCLCGRLCGPCQSGDPALISAGVVERVLPEAVVLLDGRVLRRPAGAAPRPGERVAIDQAAGIVAAARTATPHGWASADDAPLIIKPDFDAWPRPVVFGQAMTWATANGPQSAGVWPLVPVLVTPSTDTGRILLSHIQQARISRTPLLYPNLTYQLGASEAVIWPFGFDQHRLTSEFPILANTVRYDGDGRPEVVEETSAPRRQVLWRIANPATTATGVFSGQQTTVPFQANTINTPIQVPGSVAVVELEALVAFQKRNPDASVSVEQHVPDTVYLEWNTDIVGLKRQIRFTKAGFDDLTVDDKPDGQLFETVWGGGTQRYFQNGIGISLNADPASAEGFPSNGLPKSTLLSRIIWKNILVTPILDPDPVPLDFEADLGPLGIFETTSVSGSITGLRHRDHPRTEDAPSIKLNGSALSCTSWAVLARQGGQIGLLTCNGTDLIAYWPNSPPVQIGVGTLLGLTNESGQSVTVTDALLESELAVPGHPDHVRLIWQGGSRAAILAPWNAWRDLLPSDWRQAGYVRPKSLRKWYALPPDKRPTPPPHGLAVQGEIRAPTPDTAGLPRYDPSPVLVLSGNARLGWRWPWGDRGMLDLSDNRVLGQSVRASVLPLVPEGLLVGRMKAQLGQPFPVGAHWVGRAEGKAGWRPFAWYGLPDSPLNLPAGVTLDHLASYIIEDTGAS